MTTPATARERLETVIHRTLAPHMAGFAADREYYHAVGAILNAADEYATAEAGLLTPAERRRVLYEARDDIGGFQPARQTGARP